MELIIGLLHHRGQRTGDKVAHLLDDARALMMMVDDSPHAQTRAVRRWHRALPEFQQGYLTREAMDDEVREISGTMAMELKCAYPREFHFLKENHDNTTKEKGNDNHPFGKGKMVESYVRRFYGCELLRAYATLKKLLLLAIGGRFLLPYAESRTAFPLEEIISSTVAIQK